MRLAPLALESMAESSILATALVASLSPAGGLADGFTLLVPCNNTRLCYFKRRRSLDIWIFCVVADVILFLEGKNNCCFWGTLWITVLASLIHSIFIHRRTKSYRQVSTQKTTPSQRRPCDNAKYPIS